MKLEDLKDGRRYRLTRDVTNPALDKRERYDPNKLPWSEGDVFRASVGTDAGAGNVELSAVSIRGTPRRAIGSVRRYHDGLPALVEALEELTEYPSDVCARHYVEPKHVLRKLFEQGAITLAQVEAACIAVLEEPET